MFQKWNKLCASEAHFLRWSVCVCVCGWVCVCVYLCVRMRVFMCVIVCLSVFETVWVCWQFLGVGLGLWPFAYFASICICVSMYDPVYVQVFEILYSLSHSFVFLWKLNHCFYKIKVYFVGISSWGKGYVMPVSIEKHNVHTVLVRIRVEVFRFVWV